MQPADKISKSATILGIVSAGGIGLQMADRIRVLTWDQAFLIIIMILITAYLIDAVSNYVRQPFIKASEIRRQIHKFIFLAPPFCCTPNAMKSNHNPNISLQNCHFTLRRQINN